VSKAHTGRDRTGETKSERFKNIRCSRRYKRVRVRHIVQYSTMQHTPAARFSTRDSLPYSGHRAVKCVLSFNKMRSKMMWMPSLTSSQCFGPKCGPEKSVVVIGSHSIRRDDDVNALPSSATTTQRASEWLDAWGELCACTCVKYKYDFPPLHSECIAVTSSNVTQNFHSHTHAQREEVNA
jgi:hypothetical protein